MIFVHDKGRMANNILQYGHVYAWGREHKRTTMSMRFAYKYPWFNICRMRYHNFATYIFAKYAAKLHLIPTIRFDKEDCDYSREEFLMQKCKFVVVKGWNARWYDLFIKYKAEIIGLFGFDNNVEQRVAQVLGDNNVIKLGVHIRRGDYANFYEGRFFYSDEQYVNVIKSFCDIHRGERVNVYICSNDPKLNYNFYRNTLAECNVTFPNGNPAEDLCLLSHCNAIIGAPSTFSLVAAMYHNVPLYWIENPDEPLKIEKFKNFDYLFKHIY